MKKTRLLEIIREEIAGALKEVGQSPEEAKATNLAIQAKKAQILAAQKELQQLTKSGVSEIALEEDQLDEMAKITGKLESAIKNVIAKKASNSSANSFIVFVLFISLFLNPGYIPHSFLLFFLNPVFQSYERKNILPSLN
jgi:hypothetical protein